jgi:hypothetical protein
MRIAPDHASIHRAVVLALFVGWAVLGAAEDVAPGLQERLAGSRVATPDGDEVLVVAPASDPDAAALLSAEQLATCVQTVDEAEAWPAAWLVVQHADRDFDLVLRVERDDAGVIEAGDFVFTVPRREWQPEDVKRLAREVTGRKPPRKGIYNVVVQGFSRTVTTRYPYEVRPSKQGLAALLPDGTLIRESRRVETDDGETLTLALVIEGAEFLPSACGECAERNYGHADTGSIISLVLATEGELLDTLDLTAALGAEGNVPRIPRYDCREGDADFTASESTVNEWFGMREKRRVLDVADHDGDGRPLEVALPRRPLDCDTVEEVLVSISAADRKLRVEGRRAAR